MALLQHAVAVAREYLWGFPMLALLFGTHLYFTFHLGFIQKKIPLGIRLSLTGTKNQEKDQVTPYSALATALAATIGTGNIVGISTAIAIGGPGAVFWCWLTGVFGIATCYAECYLSIRYRVRRADNTFAGGPMYILDRRLKKRKLAAAFAVCTLLASFGIGSSVQSYSIRTALQHQITVSPHLVGMAVGVLAGIIIIGGNSQIAKVCMWLVPLMSAFYVGGCLYIIGRNRELKRCSDDGEPGGTAGKPMLEVLLSEGITNVVVIVTRYFGGTLLGTGGLVRAYTQAVKEGLADAGIRTMIYGVCFTLKLAYTDVGKIQYLLANEQITIGESRYTQNVEFDLQIPKERAEEIRRKLTEATAGRIQIEQISEGYYTDISG